jgi:hypothetical protein
MALRDPDPHDDWDALEEYQLRIARRLGEQSSRLASWYVAAAAVARSRPTEQWASLLAHLCREVMNAAPRHYDLPLPKRVDYVTLVDRVSASLPDELPLDAVDALELAWAAIRELVEAHRIAGVRLEPQALFAAAGLPATAIASDLARARLNRAWRNLARYFVANAHMRDRAKADPDPDRMLRSFEELEDLLGAQLRAVPYWSLEEELARIAALDEPHADDLERAVRLMRGGAEASFLEALRSPGWLPVLRAAGYVAHPPQPEKADDGVRLPFWPISRFLARIAADAPEAVVEAIESVPPTSGGRVHADFLRAARAMPPEHGASIAKLAPHWLKGEWSGFAADEAAGLASDLAGAGRIDAALDIAGAVFAVGATLSEHDHPLLGPDPVFEHRFVDDWSLRQALEQHVPSLVVTAPVDSFALLADSLDAALTAGRRSSGEEGPENDSFLWRSAIEDHEQNHRSDEPRDVLIAAVRDAAVQAVAEAPESAAAVFDVLARHPHLVFRRVELHLLRVSAAPELDERRRAALTDRGMFDDVRIHHEYFLLQRDRFGDLSEEDAVAVLRWIEEGPADLDDWAARHEEATGSSPTTAEREQRAEQWRYERLVPLADHLPPEWAQRFARYRATLGELDHPEFRSYFWAGFVAPAAPYSAADIRAMSVDVLMTAIDEFSPDRENWQRGDSLALVLGEAVAEDPAHFGSLLKSIRDRLPAMYLRLAFDGFERALRTGHAIPWDAVLALGEFVVEQPPADAPPDDDEADDGYGGARRAFTRLLDFGLRRGTSAPARPLRDRVFALIERLSRDPDPTGVADGGGRTPRDVAHGSVRPVAFRAAIAYGLWAVPNGNDINFASMQELRELEPLLVRGSDRDELPPRAVRWTLGAGLGELIFIDRAWTASFLPRLFDDTDDELRRAAWDGAVVGARATGALVSLLRDAGLYDRAIDRLAQADPAPSELDKRTAEHIVLNWWWRYDRAGELLDAYLAAAPEAHRVHAMDFIGRSLYDKDARADVDAHASLLTDLWRLRLADLPAQDAELGEFSHWYGAGVIPEPQATELMIQTIPVAPKLAGGRRVVLQAARVARAEPSAAMDLAATLLASDTHRHALRWGEDHVRELLQAVLAASDDEARARAVAFVHDLGELGLLDLRDVLPGGI